MAFNRRPSREPISGQAYASIKRRILDLTFRPGELLSETRLANEFGLSRTPVREALKRLETDGLVDVVPQHGTFVSPIRREFVMNAQYARAALECTLVRDAATGATEAALRQLDGNLLAQQAAADRGDFDTLYRLDEELHQMLAAAAGRETIWDLIADIKIHMDRVRHLTLRPDHAPTLIAQHRAIIDGVRTRDPEAAARAMAAHLRFVVEHLDELLAANPEFTVEVVREIR